MFEKTVIQNNNNYKAETVHGESHDDLQLALNELKSIEELLKKSLVHEHSLPTMWNKVATTTEDKKHLLSLIEKEKQQLAAIQEILENKTLSSSSTLTMANP